MLVAVSILAVTAAPSIKRTVDTARLSRTVADQTAIRTAIVQFLTDVDPDGFFWDGIPGGANDPQGVNILVSDGDIPRECVATVGCSGDTSSWNTAVNGQHIDFLERHLVTNNPGGNSANDYPVTGANRWRGAYLTAPIGPDPWGNRYGVNVQWLNDTTNCGGNRTNDVFVLSAGPDEIIATPFRQDGTSSCTAGTAQTAGAIPIADDIITVIRRDLGVGVP